MTAEDLLLLRSPEITRLIEENIERDPNDVALDKRVPHKALIATQVKYLRRARRKLPSYYRVRAIIPPLAFEQASGEEVAAHKNWRGDLCIDLTCGLGVDALYLARNFRQVVTVERDPVLAEVARINFSRLGAGNITVINSTAEGFMDDFAAAGRKASLIYADPDRRSPQGRKLVRIEECSPDMAALSPFLKTVAPHIVMKLSPMFDTAEAFRLFPGSCTAQAVSFGGECKEVLVETGDDIRGETIGASVIGCIDVRYPYSVQSSPRVRAEFSPPYRYTIIPDVALRKARITEEYAAECLPEAFAAPGGGYYFTDVLPGGKIPGRVFEASAVNRFDPQALKKELRRDAVRYADIYTHDFPLAAPALARRLGLREGGAVKLAFTGIGGALWVIRLKEVHL